MVRSTLTAVALASSVLIGGCAAGGSTSDPAGTAPSASGSSPTTQVSPTPKATIAELPESALVQIAGLTYEPLPGDSEAALKVVADFAAHPEAVEGVIIRKVNFKGEQVGAVYIFRFRKEVMSEVLPDTQQAMIEEWAQGDVERSTIEGQDVWQAARSRDTNIAAVLFAQGTNVVLLAAASLDDARTLAKYWIKGS